MALLVRFEINASLSETSAPSTEGTEGDDSAAGLPSCTEERGELTEPVASAHWDAEGDIDAISTAFTDLSLERPIRVIPSHLPHPPQSSLLEIKTRNPSHTYGQLVFSQTPSLYVGRHKEADFSVEPVEVISLDGPEMRKVAGEQGEVMRRVIGMVKRMVGVVKKGGSVGFVCVDGKIQVRKRVGNMIGISGMAKGMLENARAR